MYPTVEQVDAFIEHVASCDEPHGRRHSVLWRIAATTGVPPIQIAAHLGHDLQTLNNVYAHELDPTNRQEVIAQAVTDIYR